MKGDTDFARLTVALVGAPDHEAKAQAGAALHRQDVEKTGVADRAPVGAALRGRSHGNRLLAVVEDETGRRGCARAVVETSGFQAPGFYEPHGHEEFGRVGLGLPGHAGVFLRKTLR